VQRAVGPEGGEVERGLESRIRQSESGGSPLPNSVRQRLEPSLGADLSPIRVHTGAASADLNRELGARAFTTNHHIFYGAGQSPADMRLTAHEATHAVQQGAVGGGVQRLAQRVQRLSAYRGFKGGLQGIAGLLGGIGGAGAGAVGGLGLGGYNAAKGTFRALTKGKGAGRKAWAWIPAILAGLGGLAGGAVGGAVAGAGAGARASAWGTGKGVDWLAEKLAGLTGGKVGHREYGSDSVGQAKQSEFLTEEFGKSTSHSLEDLPGMPTMEPGSPAVISGSELEVQTKDEGTKKYKADQITELTAFEFTDSKVPSVYVTFYERGGSKKVRPESRPDFAKAIKYKRGQFVEGHVPKGSVKTRFNTMAVAGLGGSMPAEMNESIFPIFSSDGPQPSDISQGLSGQCWLLSPLMAIARRYPEKIRAMIPEWDDRTVAVRFFNGQGQPVYVRVTRRFLQVSIMGVKQQISSSKGKQNAVWPILILKAFAAWGGKNDPKRTFTTQSLDGGGGDTAFQFMLGQGGKQDIVHAYEPKGQLGTRAPWEPKHHERGRPWSFLADLLGQVGVARVQLGEGGTLYADFLKWTEYVQANESKITAKLSVSGTHNIRPTLDFIYRELAAAKVAKTPFGDAVLRAYAPFYGHGGAKKFTRLGINRYNQSEITFFNRLRDILQNGGAVTAGTHTGKFMQHSGTTAGGKDAKLKGNAMLLSGLQRQHAYELADVRLEDSTQERYVKLRNPWGKRKMLVVGNPEFEIPYSKFLRRFDTVYFNDVPQEPPDEDTDEEPSYSYSDSEVP
jgi:hypothetical protein